MDYINNPYLWIFCTSFSGAKFLAWAFCSIDDNFIKPLKEREKVRKLLFWISLFIVLASLDVFFYFIQPYPTRPALIFFVTSFICLFLLCWAPKIFVWPMLAGLFILSLIFVDLRSYWVEVDSGILSGQPVFLGKISANAQEYRFRTADKTLQAQIDLTVKIPANIKTIQLEVIEAHALPIWFPWWTKNYLYVSRLYEKGGDVLWKNPADTIILRYLVADELGWLSKKDTIPLTVAKPVELYWRTYEWTAKD